MPMETADPVKWKPGVIVPIMYPCALLKYIKVLCQRRRAYPSPLAVGPSWDGYRPKPQEFIFIVALALRDEALDGE